MSDEQIMNEKFDTGSVFAIAEDILKRTTHIVDSMVQQGSQSHEEKLEEKAPKASFSPTLYKLIKTLFCELMACRTPSEQTANETTKSILTKLKSYPWDAKVLLTLVAFSFEYGEFWLLAQLHPSNPLAKSVGILKRVEAILEPQGLIHKYKKEIGELNEQTKETLKVIRSILEFEKLPINNTKDVPAALSTAMGCISEDVYRATITTIVACTTQLSCLTSDEDKKQELSTFADKSKSTLENLKKQIKLRNQQIEAYRKLEEIIRAPTEIVAFLKELIFAKDDVQQLFDGSTETLVSIDELKNKNVLLFFSDLNISSVDDMISILKPIDDEIRKKDYHYKILWIPIVEQWSDDERKKFDTLQPKMSWYIMKYFSGPVRGIRFIEKKWEFNNSPILVVMNPQGKVEHQNALHMIQVWGMRAFPFTEAEEEKLAKDSNWIGDIMAEIQPSLHDSVRDGSFPVSFIKKCLVKKLDLASEAEVEILLWG
ncbi:protein SIEVE ELEMENT OCCLUSION B-like [Corylus avellana]|uniref:protein SIEVE ELEMENT OCCLUSION B-like n=1 Tax=Corylus avellana TaxID=13451 RepID=UPI00286BBE14|nr:protein SIEVE ELEMENT OCCLUSION B-like [Corylus avellana]